MVPNKIFSLLGLATRAGRLVSGEFMTEKAVKEGRAQLVLLGADASANTKKNFRIMNTGRKRNWGTPWARK